MLFSPFFVVINMVNIPAKIKTVLDKIDCLDKTLANPEELKKLCCGI
jgi:hypothetical protein